MGDGLAQFDFAGPSTQPSVPAAEVCADGETLFGIDVSHWQGSIDWNAVANDGVHWSIVRVSDGTGTLDDWFDVNLPASRAVGLPTGVYQFFRPAQDVIAQADILIDGLNDHGGLLPGDLPPVIDVEDTGGLSPTQVAAAVGVWIDHVEAELGVTPIVYTGKYFWQDNVQSTAYNDHPLWAAHYTTGCPNIADQWSDWTLWQYSDTGSVSGVSGGVDSNWFNGGADELAALLVGGGGECGDGVCDPGENPTTCPDDCPPCGTIPAEGKTIDETDACFIAGGDEMFWRTEAYGYLDSHLWTVATAATSPDNYGIWDLYFESAGAYEVEVYIEAGAAGSEQAPYQIHHDGLDSLHSVNQTSIDGWVTLGEFAFEAGGEQWIRLDDNTGEDWELDRALVYDAIRLTPMGGGGEDSADGGSTESSTGDESEAGTGDEVGTGEVGDSSSDDASSSTDAAESGDDAPEDDAACNCRASKESPPLSLLLVFSLLGLRRRGRRVAS